MCFTRRRWCVADFVGSPVATQLPWRLNWIHRYALNYVMIFIFAFMPGEQWLHRSRWSCVAMRSLLCLNLWRFFRFVCFPPIPLPFNFESHSSFFIPRLFSIRRVGFCVFGVFTGRKSLRSSSTFVVPRREYSFLSADVHVANGWIYLDRGGNNVTETVRQRHNDWITF